MKGFYHIWAWQPSCDQDAAKKTFVPPTQVGSTCNLVLIGQVVLEKMMFEICELTDAAGSRVYVSSPGELNQRTNSPVNTHLISEPIISTKPGYK